MSDFAEVLNSAREYANAGLRAEAIAVLRARSGDEVLEYELAIQLQRGDEAERAEGLALMEALAGRGYRKAEFAVRMAATSAPQADGMAEHLIRAREAKQKVVNDWAGVARAELTELEVVESGPATVDIPPAEQHTEEGSTPHFAQEDAPSAPPQSDSAEQRKVSPQGSVLDRFSSWEGVEINASLSPSAMEQILTDIVMVEQPIMSSRLVTLATRGILGRSRASLDRRNKILTAVAALVESPNVRVIEEDAGGSFDAITFVMPSWSFGTAREIGARIPCDIPLVELAAIIDRIRGVYTTITRAEGENFVLRQALGIPRLDKALLARFRRAWNRDVGEFADGSPIEPVERNEFASRRRAPAASAPRVDVDPVRDAVQSDDALALVADAMRRLDSDAKSERITAGMQLRRAAMQGEPIAVEVLVEDSRLTRGVDGFDDHIHWLQVAANGGSLAAMKQLLGISPVPADPRRVEAWARLVELLDSDAPSSAGRHVMSEAARGFAGDTLRERQNLGMRRRGLPKAEGLSTEWDWSQRLKLVDAAAQLAGGGSATERAHALIPPGLLGRASGLVQAAEHLAGAGYEMVPDPRYEACMIEDDDFVTVTAIRGRIIAGYEYRRVSLVARLAVGTAAVDGEVHRTERDIVLEHVTGVPGLTDYEQERLVRYVDTLLAAPPRVGGSFEQLTRMLRSEDRTSVLELLARIVAADGLLRDSERTFLLDAARMFDVPGSVLLDIEQRVGFDSLGAAVVLETASPIAQDRADPDALDQEYRV